MEEYTQLYICDTCESIKAIYAEAVDNEHFQKSIPERLLCGVDGCVGFAVQVDKICLGKGHVHGYSYYKEEHSGIILCSIHRDNFVWKPLRVDNVLEYTPDKPDPTRRENW